MKRTLLTLAAVLFIIAGCGGDDIDVENGSSFIGDSSIGSTGSGSSSSSSSDDAFDSTPTATDDFPEEDDYDETNFDRTISIVFSTSGDASVTGDSNSIVSVSGNDVTVNNTGDEKIIYKLSGTSSDGFFKVYSSKKQAFVLNNLSLTNKGGSAINSQCGKTTYIVVNGTSTLADGSVNSSGDYSDQTDDEDMKAALFSEGQLVFTGEGTLTVNASGKAGITSDDYIHFKGNNTISVSSALGHGVRGKDYIAVENGTIDVSVSGTGKKGFSSDSLVYIAGGATTIKVTGSAGTVDGELTGTAGIKTDQIFKMTDGTLEITNTGTGGKGINCDASVYLLGGTGTITASGSDYGSSSGFWGNSSSDDSIMAKGIKAEGDIRIEGGTWTVTSKNSEAIESEGRIDILGGTVMATASDDALNSAGVTSISGGYIYAYSSGNDGLDANANFYITGGVVYAVGCGNAEVAIDAAEGYKLYITGGTVIAFGGIESGSSVSTGYVSGSWSKNTNYALYDSNSNLLFCFKSPASGGTGIFLSSDEIESGSKYSLYSGVTISGGTSYIDGYYIEGASASGGSGSSLTASSGTYGGSSSIGGGNRW